MLAEDTGIFVLDFGFDLGVVDMDLGMVQNNRVPEHVSVCVRVHVPDNNIYLSDIVAAAAVSYDLVNRYDYVWIADAVFVSDPKFVLCFSYAIHRTLM